MQQNKPRGSVMILVVSIIMIIGSAFGLIASLITGAAGAFVKTAMTDAEIQSALAQSGLQVPAGMLSQVLTIITILSVISAIIELICAIIGIVNRNKVEKAGLLIGLGILMIVVSLVTNLVPMFMWKAAISAVSIIVGLILPVLYLIGAFLNKNS